MTLGPTHYAWRPDVRWVQNQVRSRFPSVTTNTYVGHPWPGWDGRSFDVWGPRGRGDPVDLETGHKVLAFVYNMDGAPWLRHYIYLTTLWTSFGGSSRWPSLDHSGRLRHVHFTFW